MTVPAAGAVIDFEIADNVTAGSYNIPVSGTAGSSTAATNIPITIATGTPYQAYFIRPLFSEIGVIQGSSTSVQMQVQGSSVYQLSLIANNLPAGTTATFSPQHVQAGDSFTMTISASSNAPPAQNVQFTVVGMPAANVPASNVDLLADVTTPNGVGWNNRTDYVSTRATPYAAVYDPANQLIYSSNQTWNRIDVISNATHTLLKSIPVRDPRGLDISIDSTKIWVATGSQVMYAIDTSTLKATMYQLPRYQNSPNFGSWEGGWVFSLADGTVLLRFPDATGNGFTHTEIWDPVTNTLTNLPPPTGGTFPADWGIITRSGDGKRIFSVGDSSAETCFSYDVLSKTFSGVVQLGGYGISAVASPDGSKIAVGDYTGFNLYDSNFNLIAPLPGDGGWGKFLTLGGFIFGGSVFSPDGKYLYEETLSGVVPFIITMDVSGQYPNIVGLAPAMPVIPVFTEMGPPYYVPVPFGVDNTGMVLGMQYHGISFDDSTAYLNFNPNQPGSPTYLQHASVYSGPLSGGTTSGGFGNAFSLTPDVYYGNAKGKSTLSGGTLEITSPPASAPGPVNVKILFPDGIEVYNPQFFTYGTYLQDAIVSGGPPQGGVSAKLDGFGLPIDPSGDVVTLGANQATVTSTQTQYPPFTGEQTAMFLSYTVPAGLPGWTDLTVTTRNGTATLPKAFFYAKAVTDYSSTDANSYVLYDGSRNQVYLSAGDHINVFSLASNSFLSPIYPAAVGTSKQFEGLTLTPDKKFLLAADLLDNSVAVIDPNSPSNTYAVSVSQQQVSGQCQIGPLYVAADNQGEAIVVTGGVIGIGCGPGGAVYVVNLAAKTAATLNVPGCSPGAAFVSATNDGSRVALGGYYNGGVFQIYSPTQQMCSPSLSAYMLYGGSASGDGNVFASLRAFIDPSGNILGRMTAPPVLYPGASSSVYYNYSPYQDGALQHPLLNDSGSLYYWAYPNYVEMVDVQHGLVKLRLALGETVSNTVSPMAINDTGQFIYLITNKGLTIVDLSVAPLSIGHLSQNPASVGTQVVVRGSGFESGISMTVGGQVAIVNRTDANTLSFTVPPVATGPQDLVLKNPDGTTYTLENGLVVN